MAERIDVLGLGAVAVDDLLFLSEFPRPDGKMPILRRERRAGGLAGTALVAARRLGCSCAYAGTLGEDELSRFIIEGFQSEGVTTSHLVRRAGCPPFHSTILVDTGTTTRTILYDDQGVVGADPALPSEEVIRSARVLMVDHVGLEGMVRAAGIARAAGIPVVADLERDAGWLFADLFSLADHLILPIEFARRMSGKADGPSIARALWADGRAAVVVTASGEGSWYMTAEEPGRVFHQPAFSVEAVDTNGCGDVFHGVYAAVLSEGMAAAERIRYAAAVAALKATHAGGQKGIPLRPEVDRFLGERAGEAQRRQV
ncbi:MAG: PfkB family carbohydrate kinase [Spirochaetia bacterium]